MPRLLACLVVLAGLIVVACLGGQSPPSMPVPPTAATGPVRPGEFKLKFTYDAIDRTQRERGEIFFVPGKSYQFLDGSDEIVIVEPIRRAVRIVDLARQVQTEISDDHVAVELELIRAESRAIIGAEGAGNGRANQIAAESERDLLEPRFVTSDNPTTGRLSMRNPSVQVEATGVPETNPATLAIVTEALTIDAELRAIRQPDTLPPFAQLDALHALLIDRRRIPTQMTFTFRLAATPKQYRWTYTIVPVLTDREREALGRIDGLLTTAARLPFKRFNPPGGQ